MANQEHLEQLKCGVQEWNQWRLKQPTTLLPDLSEANLSNANLRSANLRGVYLSRTNLSDANLVDANLSEANLTHTHLNDANLTRANLSNANLNRANFNYADLSRADLSDANLSEANLIYANLSNACLIRTNLIHAGLSLVNLRGAILIHADLSHAYLSGANLSFVNLDHVTFRETHFAETIFAGIDLNLVQALETAIHAGPSTININSVILPHNEQTRLHFLRGVGFTETQIEYLPSLLTPRSIQYQSLFISYASQDKAIAQRLYADLRANDVPCWFALHDLEPGDYFREEIDKAISTQEKLLLILSEHSIKSRWVKYEVGRVLNREIEQDRKILYPIHVDDTVFKSTDGWAADLRAHRHIGDFTDWQNPTAYQEAFTRLLQHLKLSGKNQDTGA
jgi:uncharacterized protein YjbI with pentapeptide repeats